MQIDRIGSIYRIGSIFIQSDRFFFNRSEQNGNRSEQMKIGPNKWKSVRTDENRSEQMEIGPNKWKSVRTNGNRSEQMEIDPNKWKSVRKMEIGPKSDKPLSDNIDVEDDTMDIRLLILAVMSHPNLCLHSRHICHCHLHCHNRCVTTILATQMHT